MLSERDLGWNLDSSKQVVNQYLDRWLELCAKPRLRAKSLKDHEGLLRRYVRPRSGSKALTAISALDIQMLYQEMLAGGLSAHSIRYTHAVLRSALKQAMRWNLILANPAYSVDLPRQYRPQLRVWTIEQARIFVKAISCNRRRSFAVDVFRVFSGKVRGFFSVLGNEPWRCWCARGIGYRIV